VAIVSGLFDQYLPTSNALEPKNFINPRLRPTTPVTPPPDPNKDDEKEDDEEDTTPTPPIETNSVYDIANNFDPSAIDLSLLQDLDLSGIDLEGLDNLTYQDVTQSLTGVAPAPTTPEGWANLYNQYSQSIANGLSPNMDVDDRTYAYNYYLGEAIQGFQGTPDEFRASVGLPDTFSIYDNPQSGISTESAQTAYQVLSGAANPMEAVSQYYGIDLQAATPNERSVYNNADKYGTTPEKMAEFQSVITPVLQQVIPYIQMTQGLRFDDALEYAYKNDPMIAALYNQYGVDLFRQTNDGSTYYYDPFSGLEARTVEVKDTSFRDVGLALTLGATAAILGPVVGGALGAGEAATTALTGAMNSAFQGGDFSDVIKGAFTAGITGPIQDYVGTALGVSDEVAAAITSAGLAKAQGADTQSALTSGFISGATEFIRGLLPANYEIDPQTGLPTEFSGTTESVQESLDNALLGVETAAEQLGTNWAKALEGAANFASSQTADTTETPEIFAGRTTGEPTVDTTTGTAGGMLTADTPAGGVEEVVVSGDGGVQYTMPSGDGVIYQTAQDLTATPYGEYWFKTIQQVDPVGYEEMLSAFEGGAETFNWKGMTFNYADMMGTGATTTQLPDRVTPETGDTTVPAEPVTVEDTTAPDQPPLPPTDETLDIPEIPVENIPPEITIDVTPPVIPPVTPESPVIPTSTGGGGDAGGGSVPTVTNGGTGTTAPPVVPTGGTEGTQGTTGTVTQGGGEEVVDIFGDAGLEGDTLGDSTVGGAEGGGAPTGGDEGTVDVTTTQEYQDLQNELNKALGNQSELEVQVSNLQNEVDAANAALAEAETAADAAEATGAANADVLRGEVAAAQAIADSLQGELDNANTALGNANSQIESLQGQLSGTQQELGTALSTIETLTGRLNAAQDAAATAQAAADAAEAAGAANAAELRAEANAANETVNNLRGQLTEANTTITGLEGQLTTVTEQNTALQGQLAEANANATDLESRLSTANIELNDLQTEYEKAVETNAANVADLENQINDKQGEVNDLESELSGANATIEDLTGALSNLEAELAAAQTATEEAIAAGEAAAEAAGEAGYGEGYGAGYGEGEGAGIGKGKSLGFSQGLLSGSSGRTITPTPFMASLDFKPELLTPLMPRQSKDYLAELIARLQQ
jgi:predicted  nucleic acid-binding Zn-ribbon protein